ncbi:hypothetical protein MMC10_008030 [Thelotrema lepadinum]|nr:hypothetical protein [Thelotrema lepadinum]
MLSIASPLLTVFLLTLSANAYHASSLYDRNAHSQPNAELLERDLLENDLYERAVATYADILLAREAAAEAEPNPWAEAYPEAGLDAYPSQFHSYAPDLLSRHAEPDTGKPNPYLTGTGKTTSAMGGNGKIIQIPNPSYEPWRPGHPPTRGPLKGGSGGTGVKRRSPGYVSIHNPAYNLLSRSAVPEPLPEPEAEAGAEADGVATGPPPQNSATRQLFAQSNRQALQTLV